MSTSSSVEAANTLITMLNSEAANNSSTITTPNSVGSTPTISPSHTPVDEEEDEDHAKFNQDASDAISRILDLTPITGAANLAELHRNRLLRERLEEYEAIVFARILTLENRAEAAEAETTQRIKYLEKRCGANGEDQADMKERIDVLEAALLAACEAGGEPMDGVEMVEVKREEEQIQTLNSRSSCWTLEELNNQ